MVALPPIALSFQGETIGRARRFDIDKRCHDSKHLGNDKEACRYLVVYYET